MATSNELIGRVLGGRYRLRALIGTGASAQVYLADDATLRRPVAVKVLHASLATDETFLRRFRKEAQSVAALNNPNVLAVYDWGHDDLPYIVAEYLAGGSLRAMLDAGHRLSLSQTLLVGLNPQHDHLLCLLRSRIELHPPFELGGKNMLDFPCARALARDRFCTVLVIVRMSYRI